MVRLDLGLNPSLPGLWRSLYPLGQWASFFMLRNIVSMNFHNILYINSVGAFDGDWRLLLIVHFVYKTIPCIPFSYQLSTFHQLS